MTELSPTPSPLPANVVRLTRTSQGIELYFPPLRTPGAASTLALFGLACFIPGFFAAVTVAPLADAGAAGMIALWLMAIFILPFIAFGVLFVALAVYLVANSLAVVVTASEIRSKRRLFGVALHERRVQCGDIAALDAVTQMRHRWPRDGMPFYSLVVRTKSGAGLTMREAYRTGRLTQFRNRNVTVAESLRGDELMGRVKREIARAARIEHLSAEAGA